MYAQTFCYHEPILSAAISPDNCLVAFASDDSTIQIWERSSGEIRSFQENSPVQSLVFSPDGNLLASGKSHHSVSLWSIQRGLCLQTLEGKSLNRETQGSPNAGYSASGYTTKGYIVSVIFSSDGSYLAATSEDGTICVWNINSGESQAILGAIENSGKSTAFAPNGSYIASVSYKSVKIWDLRNEAPSVTLDKMLDQEDLFNVGVTFSPDSTRLKVATANIITTWDIQSGDCLGSVQGHYSCDEPLILPETDGDISDMFWNMSRRGNKGHQHLGQRATFNPQDTMIISSSAEVCSLFRCLSNKEQLKIPQDTRACDLGLSEYFDWVTWKGRNVLLLPPDYQPRCISIGLKTIAIGTEAGKIIALRFSDMELFDLESK
jgi:WD40 repeat protein